MSFPDGSLPFFFKPLGSSLLLSGCLASLRIFLQPGLFGLSFLSSCLTSLCFCQAAWLIWEWLSAVFIIYSWIHKGANEAGQSVSGTSWSHFELFASCFKELLWRIECFCHEGKLLLYNTPPVAELKDRKTAPLKVNRFTGKACRLLR